MGGLGLGPLVAGALVAAFGNPLATPFWVHLALAVVAAVLLYLVVGETAPRAPGARLSFQRPGVPSAIRATFLGAATAGFAGFAVLGFLMAVSPKLIAEAVIDPGPLLVGAVASVIFAASVAAQVVLRGLHPRRATTIGIGLLIAGIAILVLAIQSHSLWVLVVAGVVAGAGQGLSFSKGLATLLARVEAHERAEVSSAFFVVAYVAISLPVIGEGLAAQAWGLTASATGFAVLVGTLAVIALAILTADQHRQAEA
jgi:predicted MFS family arabinose efflux permease